MSGDATSSTTPGDTAFDRYVSLVDVDDHEVQNVQEFSRLWGEIRGEFDEIGASIEESYAALGEVDFVVVFEAPSKDAAFQASLLMERRGLDVQTMDVVPTDRFAELVGDL